jgi:hypothetical protein
MSVITWRVLTNAYKYENQNKVYCDTMMTMDAHTTIEGIVGNNVFYEVPAEAKEWAAARSCCQ